MIRFPDAEQLVVDYLDAALPQPVSTRVPSPRPASFVRVLRTGGPRATRVSDAAQITIEAFGNLESVAADLIREARALIDDLRGKTVAGVVVYRVEELGGPANLPDPTTDQHRYTFTAVVHTRGTVS